MHVQVTVTLLTGPLIVTVIVGASDPAQSVAGMDRVIVSLLAGPSFCPPETETPLRLLDHFQEVSVVVLDVFVNVSWQV